VKTSSRPHRFNPFLPPFESNHNLPGIYKISLPEVTDLIYIGSAAQSIRKRWRVHLNDLVKKRHGNDRLQKTVNKYGLDKLCFEVLEICSAQETIEREQFWIEQHEWQQLFNVNPKASSRLGATLTAEDRLKLAEKHGGVASPETLARIAEEYANGATQVDLAVKYQVDRSSIRNYLVRLGVDLRKKAAENTEIIDRVLKLYQDHAPKVVAQVVGIDPDTVRKIARENGVLRNNSAAQKKRMAQAEARQKQAKAVGGNLFTIAHATNGTLTGYQFELAEKTGIARKVISELCRGLIEEHEGWRLASTQKASGHRKSGIKQHSFIHKKHGEFFGSVSELRSAFPQLKQAGLSLLTTGGIISYKGWEMKTGDQHIFSRGMGYKKGGEAKNIPNRKIPLSDHEEIKRSLIAGESQKSIAKRYGVTQGVISRLKKRRGW
jgi:group I intron endonuclease